MSRDVTEARQQDPRGLRGRILDWLEQDLSEGRPAVFRVTPRTAIPVVDFAPSWEGRFVTSRRVLDHRRGLRLRLERVSRRDEDDVTSVVELTQRDDELRVLVRSRLVLRGAETGLLITGSTRLENEGDRELRLRCVTSLVLPAPFSIRGTAATIHRSRNAWIAEHRWFSESLDDLLPDGNPAAHVGQESRGSVRDASAGTWVSAAAQPTAFVTSDDGSLGWEWCGSGSWAWEVGETFDVPWLAMMGGNEADHRAPIVLPPGTAFDSGEAVAALVPTSAIEDVVAVLAVDRRSRRREHQDGQRPALIYNDYLNTVNGEPEEATTLTLMAAAAEAGAEYFCIDAGWYDEERHGWWDTIGEWTIAPSRFPGGLDGLSSAAEAHGLRLGLWVEPCSIGVRSPLADTLPREAFFRREGRPTVQAGRLYFDFNSPAVIDHLDSTIDRLIDAGVQYFKFDDNVEPIAGDDTSGELPGVAVERHLAAYQSWFERLRARHPSVVFETCASGGMKTSPSQLAHFQLVSVSDQQDFRLMPPIVVNAMAAIPAEQCGVWASVQPGMSEGEAAFALATGLAGRLYLSGWLDRIPASTSALVREAATLFLAHRSELARSTPFWPLGLASWRDAWLALGHRFVDGSGLLVVWSRNAAASEISLDLSSRFGPGVELSPVFPRSSSGGWTETPAPGGLRIAVDGSSPAARVYRITRQGAGNDPA